MKNIKYTTTNKCKSKVFFTNFSILLKCEKEKKLFLLVRGENSVEMRRERIRAAESWEKWETGETELRAASGNREGASAKALACYNIWTS